MAKNNKIFGSEEPVKCNRCGQVMRMISEDYLICDVCENEAFLDSEDPENPGHPLQLIAPYKECWDKASRRKFIASTVHAPVNSDHNMT